MHFPTLFAKFFAFHSYNAKRRGIVNGNTEKR
jgi:hypothetical protein